MGCFVSIVVVLWIRIWIKLENSRRDQNCGIRLKAVDFDKSFSVGWVYLYSDSCACCSVLTSMVYIRALYSFLVTLIDPHSFD